MRKYLIVSVIMTFLVLSCKKPPKNNQAIAFTNITLIDVDSRKVREGMTLIVEDNQIVAIVSASNAKAIDTLEHVKDYSGKFIIPGLIDGHVHLFVRQDRDSLLPEMLASGITTVRDMGGDARVYAQLNERIKEGSIKGPEIYFSANVFGASFMPDPRVRFASRNLTPGEAPWMRLLTEDTNLEEAMRQAKESGVTGIKVYSSISPEFLKDIANAAHNKGLKVWGHSSIYPSRPSDAVSAGFDAISHSMGLIFETQDNMPDSFLEAIKNHVGQQDFRGTDPGGPAFQKLFEQMKNRSIIFEPTLSAFQAASNQRKPSSEMGNRDSRAAPPSGGNGNPTAHLQQAAKDLDIPGMNLWAMGITKEAFNQGVTISAGTDLARKIAWIQDEIIFLVEAGLPPIEALRAATLNNAQVIGIADTHGSLLTGKVADFVVLDKNPLENIENIRSVFEVYKAGKSVGQPIERIDN